MAEGFEWLKPRHVPQLFQAWWQSELKDEKRLYRKMILIGLMQWSVIVLLTTAIILTLLSSAVDLKLAALIIE
ncbi:MAG: hypothetical protein ACR2PH_16415 [Desulfobulbia bacterium]